MTKYPDIQTPRGELLVMGTGKDAKAFLLWNPDFKSKWAKKVYAAQQFVDSEVLRLCEPFIPLRTGMLVQSGILGTEPGEGVVRWIAPYARFQYYSPRKAGSETGPLRGPFWFERMKALYAKQILDGAQTIIRQRKAELAAKREFKKWQAGEIASGRLVVAKKTRKPKPTSIPGPMKSGGRYKTKGHFTRPKGPLTHG